MIYQDISPSFKNPSPLNPPALPLPFNNSPIPHSGHPTNYPLDADDEAMIRYKQSLGLGTSGKDLSDPNDPRHCIILSLTMDSEGRPPVTIDLAAKGSELTLKEKPFKIKEGVKFSMTAKFKVQHEILSGLHYVQIVKRKGIRVSKDQEMIVCSAFPFLLQPLFLDHGLGTVLETDDYNRAHTHPTPTKTPSTPNDVSIPTPP